MAEETFERPRKRDWREDKLSTILHDRGIDLKDPNFKGTPHRWLKFLEHYLRPYDPIQDLRIVFPPKGRTTFDNAMIVQTGIPYHALCAHHLCPVLGVAHVGYIPRNNVVGLSKLTRLVWGLTHAMPSLQEDVCAAVTTALIDYLKPLGAMCVISAEHSCMSARGVEIPTGNTTTVTSSIKGVFIDKPEARSEFYSLIEASK